MPRLTIISLAGIERELLDDIARLMDTGEIRSTPARRRMVRDRRRRLRPRLVR